VRRINILLVLDTLKADSFGAITRWGDFSQVMAGIEAAERVGFKIKLNVVKGVNEDEYDDLIRFAHRRGMDLTLNETMPMGEIERRGRETTSSQRGGPSLRLDLGQLDRLLLRSPQPAEWDKALWWHGWA